MGQAHDYNVTSAGISAEEDRHHRMKVYFIMMAIRMACVASLLFLRGWWILLAIIGGVFLPYVAVLIANQPRFIPSASPEQPEPLQIPGAEPEQSQEAPIIVVDEPAERRAGPNQDSAEPDAPIPTYDIVHGFTSLTSKPGGNPS